MACKEAFTLAQPHETANLKTSNRFSDIVIFIAYLQLCYLPQKMLSHYKYLNKAKRRHKTTRPN